MASEHRGVRRAAGAVATIVLARAGGIGLLLFFVARDDAPVEHRGATTSTVSAGPGEGTAGDAGNELPMRDRARLLRALEAGNVVLVYGERADRRRLEALAEEVAGEPDPALEEAGQAVLVARRRGRRGVVGLAYQRILRVASPSDPELRRFADAWLGRGAGG